jgi:hypothetical protein
MRNDERELHDLEMWARYVRIQDRAASIGSVRCCTSARRAKRKSSKSQYKFLTYCIKAAHNCSDSQTLLPPPPSPQIFDQNLALPQGTEKD